MKNRKTALKYVVIGIATTIIIAITATLVITAPKDNSNYNPSYRYSSTPTVSTNIPNSRITYNANNTKTTKQQTEDQKIMTRRVELQNKFSNSSSSKSKKTKKKK